MNSQIRSATLGEELYLGIDWQGKLVFYPKGLRISDCAVTISNRSCLKCDNVPKTIMLQFYLDSSTQFVLCRTKKGDECLEYDGVSIPLHIFLQASVADIDRAVFTLLHEDELAEPEFGLPEHLRGTTTEAPSPAALAAMYRS